MAELCTLDDVQALSGVPVAQEEQGRVYRLIEMASDVVAPHCVSPLPDPVPAAVAMVTAGLVVRQIANPTALSREGIAGYQVDYGAGGMVLTEDDLANLGSWGRASSGSRFYTVPLVGAGPTWPAWPVDWWSRDLDSVP